ncbi:MAG: ligase-associated DNA damage response exonuclease [Cytophagaceae bacterium]|nr:ligase-associated DNA damage response exonuclease [Cytophagaceae bacterium]
MGALLELTSKGIYCPPADLYLDPWRPVERAVITHAHSDHARWGMKQYIATPITVDLMHKRLGKNIQTQRISYKETFFHNGVQFSLHPAGHVPGSAQIRVEYKGEVWVFTGDFKIEPDAVSDPFESVPCHSMITECTFGLPIYRWPKSSTILHSIAQWHEQNKAQNLTTVLVGYSLGKAQRLLAGLSALGIPLRVHSTIADLNESIPTLRPYTSFIREWTKDTPNEVFKNDILIVPPAAADRTTLEKRLGPVKIGYCSGWMQLRGYKNRTTNIDKGFVLSDHADWNGLLQAIKQSGAQNIYTTHGYSSTFAQWLSENGWKAQPLQTEFISAETDVMVDE